MFVMPEFVSLPANLLVSGWLELGHSGLTRAEQLPVGLSTESNCVMPGSMSMSDRLSSRNDSRRRDPARNQCERRRVLLDRYGFSRFLIDARADILDRDTDPGGQRELVRLQWVGDEDLVALSCFCPSTGRHYMIRVPPTTPTCRHAAAWIAGFDNPDEYRPIQET